jgi:phage repressor protein C with HTH and peptisase S24 domain
MGLRLPWQKVTVTGHSMTPTLLPGAVLIVKHGASILPGSIVVARFRSRPKLIVIKRAVRESEGGWLLSSDNSRAGSDSREYGIADVDARALWIWQAPLAGQRRRWLPKRAEGYLRLDL